jgi:hypothetical protein
MMNEMLRGDMRYEIWAMRYELWDILVSHNP